MTTHAHHDTPPVALITGASRGLGLALAEGLAARGWRVIGTARNAQDLRSALHPIGATAIAGSITDTGHRLALASVVEHSGRLDLLIHNAGDLGATPLPPLVSYPLMSLRAAFESTVIGPLALTQRLLPHLRAARGSVWSISSDAACEAYPGWGGYGAVKAAQDQLVKVFSAEEPAVRWLAIDPGDLRTKMHQDAYPGQDISDRPLPATVVPAMVGLLDAASGRYRAAELATS